MNTSTPSCGLLSESWTIHHALHDASHNLSIREAQILLCHTTGLSRTELATYPDRPLSSTACNNFKALVDRRQAGEPIAYLVGQREFYSRNFIVNADVLIPRPETEQLVDISLGKVLEITAPMILDLGCGSGCIAATLSLERPGSHVTAVDRSAAALAITRRNAALLGAPLLCIESDGYSACAGQRYHLIVTNPPYIAIDDPHRHQGDLRFEPTSALVSGQDGLDLIRIIVAGAAAHLLPAGWLLIEHGYDQAIAVRNLFEAAGFTQVEQHRDLAGILRITGGQMTRSSV